MKSCMNCHNGTPIDFDRPCFGKSGCYYQKGYPKWEPLTNGDKVRRMSDEDLAALLVAYQGKHVKLDQIVRWLGSDSD